MNNYPNEIFSKIITEQSNIVGQNLARSRALSTGGVTFKDETHLEINGDPKELLDSLINAYGEIFGQASMDVCVDVLSRMNYNEIEPYLPENLKQLLQQV